MELSFKFMKKTTKKILPVILGAVALTGGYGIAQIPLSEQPQPDEEAGMSESHDSTKKCVQCGEVKKFNQFKFVDGKPRG